MKRSELTILPKGIEGYVNIVDDIEVIEALNLSLKELQEIPLDKWQALGDKVYAPGKWTAKQLLQHVIDTERVFAYRALAFARKETQTLISFDEDLYAANAPTSHRTLDDIYKEAILVRQSTIALFLSFTEEMLHIIGKSSINTYSVGSIGFVIAGHQRWHFKVLGERYFPLLNA
ncbi:MAG: DinB family protein [Chitinophagales bacterium]|nr:DinB family protein [Bacteroidota bacterium]